MQHDKNERARKIIELIEETKGRKNVGPTQFHQIEEELMNVHRRLGSAINWMHDYLSRPMDGRNDPFFRGGSK